MIEMAPEAALELLDARDAYERARAGLGDAFEAAAQQTLDAIAAAPEPFAAHRFTTTPGVHRAVFVSPLGFPYALAYLVRPGKSPYVLAAEHVRRPPVYWAARLRAATPPEEIGS